MGKHPPGVLWLGELEIEFQFGGKKADIQIVYFSISCLKEREILVQFQQMIAIERFFHYLGEGIVICELFL